MAYRYTEEDLKKLGLELQPDGSYKKKTGNAVASNKIAYHEESGKFPSIGLGDAKLHVIGSLFPTESPTMRKVTLNLFGIPMPKQGHKSFYNGKLKTMKHYQPTKITERVNDYKFQIKNQLPSDFKIFEHEVHIRKWHFIYPPLKSFHKIKGRMEALRNGEIFYKNTRADLIDNVKKLVADSMSGLVYVDDALIVTENDTAKYYGIGGAIIIELEGW